MYAYPGFSAIFIDKSFKKKLKIVRKQFPAFY
ncbi:hypothetical protein LMOSLCC5850_0865 [Listeria monocytogenes SLCC5850]|nr:hypothetical protein LMOSLCC5850_0865 [Listeria monocytogenes SLCC5850]